MRLKPVDPDAVIRDPHTRMPLPKEGGDVPESTFWTRRYLAGEVLKWNGKAWVSHRLEAELVAAETEQSVADRAPTGREPITPLTTRRGE